MVWSLEHTVQSVDREVHESFSTWGDEAAGQGASSLLAATAALQIPRAPRTPQAAL